MRDDSNRHGGPVIAAWLTVIALGVICGALIDGICWVAVSR